MTARRSFIKKSLAGMAVAGFAANHPVYGNVTNSVTSVTDNWLGEGTEVIRVQVQKPLFCPYHSLEVPGGKRGGRHYYQSEPFTHNPFTIPAAGMSGSPIIIDANGQFIGFMTTFGFENSTFSFDGGNTLTITIPKGQELFIEDNGNGTESWRAYNKTMMERLNIKPLTDHPKFWSDVEYCTWVEQKYHSKVKGGHFNVLTHDFVKNYVDNIIALGYPKGKVTLDHGWAQFPDGTLESGYGSWVPDTKKFPDFKKTMAYITEKGFTPGLWIGFPKIHKNSLIAKKNPNMLGQYYAIGNGEKNDDNERYLNPLADIYDYASEVIGRFVEMGVRKFKIDMSYNTKSDMLPIHKELYRAAKNIDKDIEMEFHVPDIFFAKYADVIRTNDVWLTDNFEWQDRVATHYKVASGSCPGRGINLDHVGGNAEWALSEEKYLEHLAMYESKTGYPCVSILPSHISKKCVDKTGEYLWKYEKSDKKILTTLY